ncbi:MAG: translation elongation factor-like protein [Thermodesulfobacteriota bacterium]
MGEERVGTITHYYTHLNVAAVDLGGPLRVGDTIHVKGHTSDFTQKVDSIQIEHESVEEAGVGVSVGIKLIEHGREHDEVYKVTGG